MKLTPFNFYFIANNNLNLKKWGHFFPSWSLFPPSFLGLDLHNFVNFFLWRDCVTWRSCLQVHLFRISSFHHREKDASISACRFSWSIAKHSIFQRFKVKLKCVLFIALAKNPGTCVWVVWMWVPSQQKFTKCTLSLWASRPRLFLILIIYTKFKF